MSSIVLTSYQDYSYEMTTQRKAGFSNSTFYRETCYLRNKVVGKYVGFGIYRLLSHALQFLIRKVMQRLR